jgi:predicted small lipoprotein YifL
MRTKSLIIATLILATLAACHKKGGGYLAPTPNNGSSVTR